MQSPLGSSASENISNSTSRPAHRVHPRFRFDRPIGDPPRCVSKPRGLTFEEYQALFQSSSSELLDLESSDEEKETPISEDLLVDIGPTEGKPHLQPEKNNTAGSSKERATMTTYQNLNALAASASADTANGTESEYEESHYSVDTVMQQHQAQAAHLHHLTQTDSLEITEIGTTQAGVQHPSASDQNRQFPVYQGGNQDGPYHIYQHPVHQQTPLQFGNLSLEQIPTERMPSAEKGVTPSALRATQGDGGGNGGEDDGKNDEKVEEGGVFVHEAHGEIDLQSMHWIHASLVMIAETISLGILSLPSVLAELGFIPGVIVILLMSVMTTYTGYVLGQFKMRYPHVNSMADAGQILFGRWGREIFGFGSTAFLIFVMASHVLAFSYMMNVLTSHGMCTIIFMVIGTIISFVFTLPRTLKTISYFSIASFLSVIAAVAVVMGAVAWDRRGVIHPDVQWVRAAQIGSAFTGVTNVAFAYAGHLTFFTFISEMKTPRDYPKALVVLQISDTILYLLTAVVVYLYVGPNVQSPALGSTSELISQIAYGIAAPTIVISGVINGQVAAKYIFGRFPNGEEKLKSKSKLVYMWWTLLCALLWVVAWLLAEAIPVFNTLLAIISALFVSWFSFGINGIFWFHLNKGEWMKNKKNMFLSFSNGAMIVVTLIIMGFGLYSSYWGIVTQAGGKIFSCADNTK